ncbi:DEAD/DEAH box helicase [uncultured Thiodictyon sp.]|uniref:DEAD/DEAH box helicase n=1 Tax=uncultured Thiodictyon sp. TaxID=1846217 RepID=UPI0025FA406D|nr:DEAD/DEAH box helicase [uncultured Thiodictyon sp.]
MADLQARYAALNTDERRILRVLSVVCEPIAQTLLQLVLDALGWRDEAGAPLSRLMAKTLRERLLADGLIEQRQNTLTCHPDLLEPLTRESVADGTFPAITKAAESVVSAKTIHSWEQPGEGRRLRLLRLALYGGQERRVLELLGVGGGVPVSQVRYAQVGLLARVCLRPADSVWLAALPPRLQILALCPLLREWTLDLVADPSTYALAERLLTPLAAAHPDAAEFLAEQRLLRGRVTDVPALLAGCGDPAALTLNGWRRVLQGGYAQAIECFEAAELVTRKLTRKRNLYTPGIPGVLYLMALLQRGARADFDLVQKQVALCLRASVSDPVAHAYRVLGDLAAVLAGQRRLEESAWLRRDLGARGAFALLFQALAAHWLERHLAAEAQQALAACARTAVAAGFDWYAHEAVAVLRAGGFQGELPTLGEPPTGLVLMTGLLTPKPAWELALEALKGLGDQPAALEAGADAAAGSDQRMAWLFTLYAGLATLEPREQKRMKRGGWSMGRPVSLAKLAEETDSFPYLTPQDRAILACIVKEREQSWYHGAERTLYRMDQDRALLAAVGHPLVFRLSTEGAVALLHSGPTLAAVRQRKDIRVSIEPFPPEDRAILPVEETPLRIRLVEFDARHRQIARILGPAGLLVPKGGEERLLEGLTAVAPMLTVHSDIGGGAGNAETVPADPRPHLHLSLADGGLSLELHVHPFGEDGPELRPGQGGATLFTERAGRAVRCTRDLKAELTAAEAVPTRCPELAGSDGWSWHLDDPEQALSALEQVHALGDSVVLDWPQGKRIALSAEAQVGQMRVAVKKQGDWLAVDGRLRLSDGRVLIMRELLELAAASRGRFVRLGEDDFLVLSNALRRRLDGLRGLTDAGRFHPLAAPVIAELVDGMELEKAPVWKALLGRLAAMRDLEPVLPSTLQAELRDYQAEGYRWLSRLAFWGAGACLADDMGLGKTVQALALILSRAPQGPTLVLAPMSVCANWIEEARRFAPTLRPQRFGPGDRAAVLKDAGPFDLIVCSYGLLQTEAERLAGVQWETIVADEAQAFKNALTKRSQAIMRLSAGFRMIATGTPIENHLGEIWNLFQFINPGLLGSLEAFNRRFANPIELNRDQGARARLRQLLRPFILRRLKSEVLSELPPRTEITLQIELSEGEQALYEAVRLQALARLAENPETNPGQQRMQLLAEIMRLRRACCHPQLALPGSELPSAKLDTFAEIVEELLENRHKALVFSQFVDHLRLIRAHLDARGIRYQYLDGSTPETQRRAAVAAFQAGEGDLFLISLRAGGVGLNLTAADYVIHMDPWWNPAVEDQASDRAHRIGQERPVTVYRLVAKDTIEEQILKLHATKRDLADGLLEGTGDGGRLSYADMLALVRGADGPV